jgi:hypothetical protein
MNKNLTNFSTQEIHAELERRNEISYEATQSEITKDITKLVKKVEALLRKEKIKNVEVINLRALDKEKRNNSSSTYLLNGRLIKPSNRCYRNDETPEEALVNHIKMLFEECKRYNKECESIILGIKDSIIEHFFYRPDVYDALGGAKTEGRVIKKVNFCASMKVKEA